MISSLSPNLSSTQLTKLSQDMKQYQAAQANYNPNSDDTGNQVESAYKTLQQDLSTDIHFDFSKMSESVVANYADNQIKLNNDINNFNNIGTVSADTIHNDQAALNGSITQLLGSEISAAKNSIGPTGATTTLSTQAEADMNTLGYVHLKDLTATKKNSSPTYTDPIYQGLWTSGVDGGGGTLSLATKNGKFEDDQLLNIDGSTYGQNWGPYQV